MAGSIFLTGGAGFLGKRVAARLASGDRELICLIRGAGTGVSAPKVECVSGDLRDPKGYRAALAGCETIVHLAALTGKHAPAEYAEVNRDCTRSLIEEARQAGVKRFVFVSTIAVTFRDTSGYPYAQSKLQAEEAVEGSGLAWTIIRPTMIFGEQAPVLQGLSRLASLPLVPIFGDGQVPVQPVFVDDLADCIRDVTFDTGFERQVLEIGGPEVLGIQSLLQRIRRSLDKREAPVCHIPVGPVAACLRCIEPLARSVLPLTAGQLASFSNPGTSRENPWTAAWRTQMKGVDAMLRAALRGA